MRTILNFRRATFSSLCLLMGVTVSACTGNAGLPAAEAGSNTAAATQSGAPPGSMLDWISEMRTRVKVIPEMVAKDAAATQREVLDIYIGRQEFLEQYYGPAGTVSAGGELGDAVILAERMFHDLMGLVGKASGPEPAKVRLLTDSLDATLAKVSRLAVDKGVPLTPPNSGGQPAPAGKATPASLDSILAWVGASQRLFATGDHTGARQLLEKAYLEGFEPLEPLLPSATVARVEELVHMRLRPALTGKESADRVDPHYSALIAKLSEARDGVAMGHSAWFAAASSFSIILREGLEAVLLLAAMIAFLSRSADLRKYTRSVYLGAAAGVALSVGTWGLARTLIPISGGNRELLEGITALIAVAVLLYVSHWIFRRTYVGEWREYLDGKIKQASGTGSGLAIASLSIAIVYREGFETVLFYEALLVDLPGSSVALGFAGGAALVLAAAFAIIRAGVRLPIKLVFRATNFILLFLSVVIVGKGLYSLQEAGLFSPHPVSWLPNSDLLRQVLGFYPLAETLLAQLLLVSLVVVMYPIYRRKGASVAPRATARAVA
jgi:FTR1 family protein